MLEPEIVKNRDEEMFDPPRRRERKFHHNYWYPEKDEGYHNSRDHNRYDHKRYDVSTSIVDAPKFVGDLTMINSLTS